MSEPNKPTKRKLHQAPTTIAGYRRDTDKNVYDSAIERIAYLYGRFEHVVVNFSGGKDSTVVLNLAVEVATALNKLPVVVKCVHDELLDPETVDFIERTAKRPELDMDILCIPVMHSLKSKTRTFWLTWDPAEQDRWVYAPPKGATLSLPNWESPYGGFEGVSIAWMRARGWEVAQTCIVTGVRVQEAFNRLRTILNSTSEHLTWDKPYPYAKPIYDWQTEDVWKYISGNGLDYSVHYDNLRMMGVPLTKQRMAPWGNVSSRETTVQAQLYPDIWNRAIKRIPELAMTHQLENTGLLSGIRNKPVGMTWQEYTLSLVNQQTPELKAHFMGNIRHILETWHIRSTVEFPDDDLFGGGMTGSRSWRGLAHMIMKHDHLDRSR